MFFIEKEMPKCSMTMPSCFDFHGESRLFPNYSMVLFPCHQFFEFYFFCKKLLKITFTNATIKLSKKAKESTLVNTKKLAESRQWVQEELDRC
jgi:hypothetical protein